MQGDYGRELMKVTNREYFLCQLVHQIFAFEISPTQEMYDWNKSMSYKLK